MMMETKSSISNVSDENAISPKEELHKNDMAQKREMARSRELAKEVERLKAMYDREKFKVEQYNREMESMMDDREQQLEKYEQEIFELVEAKQRLLSSVEKFQAELNDEKQQNRSLAEQLAECQKQLLEERNRSLPCNTANDTALFEAEAKVEELKSSVESLKGDVKRLFNENLDLSDQVQQLKEKLDNAHAEVDSLRSLADCQRSEVQMAREETHRLLTQLHELQSGGGPTVATQGNSLFAEVIEGKDKLEKQLLLLHHQNRKLRQELNRAMKLAYENAMSRTGINGKLLSGPTLDLFKALKSELEARLDEKQSLLERLHAVEESERRHARQWARECPTEYNLFQENIHLMNMNAKQRAESRVLKLEMREQELLNAVYYEKQRAASVPQLEQRIAQMERALAHYERAQLALDEDDAAAAGLPPLAEDGLLP